MALTTLGLCDQTIFHIIKEKYRFRLWALGPIHIVNLDKSFSKDENNSRLIYYAVIFCIFKSFNKKEEVNSFFKRVLFILIKKEVNLIFA